LSDALDDVEQELDGTDTFGWVSGMGRPAGCFEIDT
jgi:hypothetical protein